MEKCEIVALLQSRMMKRDPEIHTRWKHKRGWHNRGNVWEKMVTKWAGEENWMKARKRKITLEEKYKFVTFVLGKMKLSILNTEKE